MKKLLSNKKSSGIFYLLIILITLTKFVIAAPKQECIVTRTIFEMGSGSIKAKKAMVNTCKKVIIETLAQKLKTLPLQEYIEKSPNKSTLPQEAIKLLLKNISEIEHELNVNCKKSQCLAIGTAALRNAQNKHEVITKLERKNIKGLIIPQEEEGKLGYLSTLANIHSYPFYSGKKLLLTLDIGGGSTQLSYKTGHFKIINAKIGSQKFKAMVIEYIKNYDVTKISNPNPMTEQEITQAKRLANQVIGTLLLSSPGFRYFLENRKDDLQIIGIGNFLNKMIPSILIRKKWLLSN
ncbi:MAG: hypothetical protein HRU36_03285 [Rickettsiales bacterium]|nr:hypothetical protein [Rickettsiales bacterium]